MKKTIRRVNKLLNSPGPSIRDYLLRRYPIEKPAIKDPLPQGLMEGFMQPIFPVDIVYTWVDNNDPKFCRSLAEHIGEDFSMNGSATSQSRWTCHDELRFSLRSIEAFAPWVRNIFIVTNGQRPSWLVEHPKVRLVTHQDILDEEYLPTFNSHVLSSALHRIEGLSEHYIYFNDDILLLRPTTKTDFFTENGLMYGFISPVLIPNGPPCETDLPSVWAAKNSADLIFRKWTVMFTNRMKHTFVPQRKSVAIEAEQTFSERYSQFRNNKFRAKNDLLCAGFLHPYIAYLTGKGLLRRNKTSYVSVRNKSSLAVYAELLANKGTPQAKVSVCINDAGKSNGYNYAAPLMEFMQSYYPEPSEFERLQPPTFEGEELQN